MRYNCLLILGVFATGAQADLLTNGSFESLGTFTLPVGPEFPYYDSGSTGLPGWTAIGDVHNIYDAALVPKASNGNYYMDLTGVTGYDKGLVSNAFATVAGAQYTLKFDLGGLLSNTFGNASVEVQINGTPVAPLFVNNGLSAVCANWPNCGIDWKTMSYNFTAQSGSTTVAFLGRANGADSNPNGILLDNVSVVPEPQAYGLALAGMGVVAVALRRRRDA